MIRLAQPQDRTRIESFLTDHIEGSMFLLSNLRDHGMTGSDHAKSTTFWLAEQGDTLRAVFGHTKSGYLLISSAGFDRTWAPALQSALEQRRVIGLTGRRADVAGFTQALGLTAAAPKFHDQQPLYQLSLSDLLLPEGPTQLRPMAEQDLDLVADWRLAFDQEIFGDGDLPEGRHRSLERAQDLIRTGRGRILHLDGDPVAMTAFNAVLPEAVQIGSVYTPPAQRGNGYARRAVALHLAEAARQGVGTAILFSAGPAANRAYEAIGFSRIGDFTVIDYTPPVIIGELS